LDTAQETLTTPRLIGQKKALPAERYDEFSINQDRDEGTDELRANIGIRAGI